VNVGPVAKNEYETIVEIWEASVRATHAFLPEEDILYFRPLILEKYLDAVDLRGARDDDGRIAGFLGVADDKLEMLFLAPERRGQGLGRLLLEVAVREMGVTKVDVNEQNPGAVGFYAHCGFRVVSRDPLDGLGKPYPILHMELQPT